MATVLYIKASPMGERSFSIAVADAFVETCRELNPDDTIKTIELFEKDLPQFDFLAASAKYKIMHQKPHTVQKATKLAKNF